MFTYKSALSANQDGDLEPGLFVGCAVVYRLEDGAGEFVLTEFSRLGTNIVIFVELLVRAEGQEGIFYADFLKRSDGLWRDSNGKKAHSLAELLPPATLSAVQVEQISLGPVEHAGGVA